MASPGTRPRSRCATGSGCTDATRPLICRLAALLFAVLAVLVPSPATAADSVVVVSSNGWHTGIAIPRGAIGEVDIPELADFPDAAWFEFGWGDAEYYPAPDPTLGMALKAGLLPTAAVIHVIGMPAPPEATFPTMEHVAVPIDPDGLQRLVGYLDATFERHGAVRASPSAPGEYSFSAFYPATGSFHLFNTCNTWVARGLAAAGLPVDSTGVVRAEELMTRVRPLSSSLGDGNPALLR